MKRSGRKDDRDREWERGKRGRYEKGIIEKGEMGREENAAERRRRKRG